jgi:ATP-dependent exoDNAse (exonuclease V) beta subunit
MVTIETIETLDTIIEDTNLLEKRNSHPRDRYIQFYEEDHRYTIHGSSEGYISVTTLIHTFFPHFDSNAIAKKVYAKHNKNPDSEYYNMSIDDIIQKWEDNRNSATKAGTEMHKCIELYFNNILRTDNHTKEFTTMFLFGFLKDYPDLVPYRTEWCVYDQSIKLSGSIDMTFLNPDGTLDICDWKRSREIKKENRWESGFGILSDLPHANYHHYSLQLNIYKRILETNYDKKIRDMYLIVLHPDNDTYLRYDIPDLKEYVDKIWERTSCQSA